MSGCPDGRNTNYDFYWYRLTDMPEVDPIYLTCSRGFLGHVQGTELSGDLELVHWPGLVTTTCAFCLPSIKDSLWPAALEAGDAELLRAYLRRRAKVKV